MPVGLTAAGFAALKLQASVLKYIGPEACDSPYYQLLEIISEKRKCYIVEHKGGTLARVPEQIIPAETLSK